jgi:hypothetical protein
MLIILIDVMNATLESLTLDEVRQDLSEAVSRLSLVRAHRDGRALLDFGGNLYQRELRVDEAEDAALQSLEECHLWLERWNRGERD